MRPRWASWKVTSGGKCEHQGTAATSVEAHGGSHHYPCCLAPQCLRLGCAGQQEFKEAMAEEGCRRLPGMYPGCEDHHRALGAIWEYCARRSVKISSVWYICPPKISRLRRVGAWDGGEGRKGQDLDPDVPTNRAATHTSPHPAPLPPPGMPLVPNSHKTICLNRQKANTQRQACKELPGKPYTSAISTHRGGRIS